MPKQQWQPLEDGEYNGLAVCQNQTIIAIRTLNELGQPFWLAKWTAAKICLCQLVDVDTPQPTPDEVVSTLRNALALLKRDDEFYLAGRHEDEINAALEWLDGLAKE